MTPRSRGAAALLRVFALGCAAAAGAAQAADTVRGGDIYRRHCANCHGASGISTWPGAPNVARGEGMLQPDRMLLARIRAGRGTMPGYLGMLNDRDILDVVAYMRTLMR